MLTMGGKTVGLPTNETTESSGYRIPVRIDAGWFLESRTC